MSAFAGIVFHDHRAPTPEPLNAVLPHLRPYGGDAERIAADSNAILAHVAYYTTPEAAYEEYPMRTPRGDWLLADVRLDNRDDLIRTLRLQPTSDRPITDGELILAAHERWGNDAPIHLIGDFAYAFWDGTRQTLQLVRSPYAPKLLFYRLTADGIAFASSLPALRALAPEGLHENHAYLANFIVMDMARFHDETLYKEILKVPHAHYVTWSPQSRRAAVREYWQLHWSDRYDHLRSDDDWRDAFRATFEEAVATRLRTAHPISMAVSGGIDSSAIASIAHRMMYGSGTIPPRPTYLYTDRMTGWQDTEEATYRNQLVASVPHFHAEWLDIPHAWTWEIADRWHRLASAPFNLVSAFWCDWRIQAARSQDSRVMLNGAMGDFLTGEEDYASLEVLYSMPIADALRELPYFLQMSPRGLLRFGKRLARLHLPDTWFRWFERTRGQPQIYTERTVIEGKGTPPPVPTMGAGRGLQQQLVNALGHPFYTAPFEQMGEIFAANGVEHRFPFYHRPFVEMCFHLPVHLRRHRGETRLLLKQALAGDFPPSLLTRNSKAGFSRFMAFSASTADHVRAFDLPPDAVSLHHGWIDLPTWQRVAALPKTRPMAVIYGYRAAHMEAWRKAMNEG